MSSGMFDFFLPLVLMGSQLLRQQNAHQLYDSKCSDHIQRPLTVLNSGLIFVVCFHDVDFLLVSQLSVTPQGGFGLSAG